MVIVGYSLAWLMGITLGLIGAGGSILTVPILVYVLNVKPVVATGYSLLIVGTAAFSAAITYWRRGIVNFKSMLIFSIPAMFTVLATRAFIVPSLPSQIGFVSKDNFIMLVFATLMLFASMFMYRPAKVAHTPVKLTPMHLFFLIIISMGVGLVSGFVGAGGGFLIIPTLIAFFGLGVKEAIGTSLAIIAMNSLVGFRGDVRAGIHIDWSLLLIFIGFTLLGIAVGTYLGKHMEAQKLKRFFAHFIFVISLVIFTQEFITIVYP